uniref:G_PROTEIN_RECEP_F1_2 domain-containing protein n=2 Tax=Panagrellus redivivus TaxID=6233 RepID=A0A7E4UWK5_PANRE
MLMASTSANATILAETCAAAQDIVTPGLVIIMIAVALLDGTSLILFYFYGRCYITNKSLQPNFKILITALTVALALRNFLTMIRAFRMLLMMIVSIWHPCALLTIYAICGFESTINIIPIEVATHTFALVAIERVIATVFYKKYENIVFVKTCIFVTVLMWIIQLSISFPTFAQILQRPPTLMSYCSSMSTQTVNLGQLVGYRIPIDIVIVIIAAVTYYINKRADPFGDAVNGSSHLTSRYQRSENIEATKNVTLHIILYLLVQILNLYSSYWLGNLKLDTVAEFAVLKETTSLCYPIHGNVHVILILITSKRMRYKFFTQPWLCRISPRFCKGPSSPQFKPSQNTDANYFEQYKRQWGSVAK